MSVSLSDHLWRSYFGPKNCLCSLTVSITSVAVSGQACTYGVRYSRSEIKYARPTYETPAITQLFMLVNRYKILMSLIIGQPTYEYGRKKH